MKEYTPSSQQVMLRAIKFLTMTSIMTILAKIIPTKRLEWREISSIGLAAGTIFAIIDTYSPSYRVYLDKDESIIKIV